jgi:hypothetical protein
MLAAGAYFPGCLDLAHEVNQYLVRQFNFPDEFAERDREAAADHDRLMSRGGAEYERVMACFERHTGARDQAFADWARDPQRTDKEVFAFMKDILGADPTFAWTGYRIQGGVNRSNGARVWTLQLFAKNPQSRTRVYSGEDAPNVFQR